MNLKKKYALLLSAILLGVSSSNAQQYGDSMLKKSYEYYQLKSNESVWSLSGVAAGIGIERLQGLGIVDATGYYRDGDYHRAQEASGDYGAVISTSSFSKLSKYFYGYGSFSFKANRELGRAWSDMRETYAGLPYTYGSAIEGEYDHQQFSLSGRISTIELNGFTYGISVDYSTFDMSRLIDPRPRTLALDVKIAPSVTYRLNATSHLMAEFRYEYVKDRMSGITTVQDDVVFEYYLMKGLENHSVATQLGTISQQEFDNGYGAQLGYSINNSKFNLLIRAGYMSHYEELINSSTGKRSYGDYSMDRINFNLDFVASREGVQHRLDLDVDYRMGSAQEFVQENVNITDPNGNISSQWVTMHKFVTYKDVKNSMTLNYKMYHGNIANYDFSHYLGLSAEYDMFDNKYLLPASNQTVSLITAGLNGGVRLFRGANSALNFNAEVKYRMALQNELNVADQNILYDNILSVDYNYFNENVITGNVDLTYNRVFGKARKAQSAYIKMFYNYDYTSTLGNMQQAGVSLGIYL